MKQPSSSNPGNNRTAATVFAAMTALFVYMIWLEINGQPMPEWLLWATTIL